MSYYVGYYQKWLLVRYYSHEYKWVQYPLIQEPVSVVVLFRILFQIPFLLDLTVTHVLTRSSVQCSRLISRDTAIQQHMENDLLHRMARVKLCHMLTRVDMSSPLQYERPTHKYNCSNRHIYQKHNKLLSISNHVCNITNNIKTFNDQRDNSNGHRSLL